MDRRAHWDVVFKTQGENVSWHESLPTLSLQMLESAGLTSETCVVDVGGGDSYLVDVLVARGLDCVAVLDVSHEALARARARVGARAQLTWIEADVTGSWSLKPMDIWHDRAVLHFLTSPAERARYRARLCETLKPEGSAIIATFAPNGPETCSGLPVVRYSPESLANELGPQFHLVEAVAHVHRTPWDTTQSFQYSRFVRVC